MNDEIVQYIEFLNRELETQTDQAGGWPSTLNLPIPKTQAQKEAIAAFLAELAKGLNATIEVVFFDQHTTH